MAKKLWVVIVCLLIAIASYISLGRYLVANIEKYSDNFIQSFNSEAPLIINTHRVSGIWRGLTPELIIDNAKIHFKNDFFEPLEIDQARLSFRPIASLLAQSPRFYEIKIYGARTQQDFLKNKSFLFEQLSSNSTFDNKWIKNSLSNIKAVSLIDSHIDLSIDEVAGNPFTINLELRRFGKKHKIQFAINSNKDRVFQFALDGIGDPFRLNSYYGDIYFFANLESHKSTASLFSSLVPGKVLSTGRIESWLKINPDALEGHVKFFV